MAPSGKLNKNRSPRRPIAKEEVALHAAKLVRRLLLQSTVATNHLQIRLLAKPESWCQIPAELKFIGCRLRRS